MGVLLLVGCDESQTPPGPPDEDVARECVPAATPTAEAGAGMDGGAALACDSGEVCIAGRCYAECTDDAQCGPREMCANGVCVRRVGPMPDAGGMDSGPGMPCDGVMCPDPEVCHPLTGVCGACSEATVNAPDGTPGACPGLQPICDIANGRCVERMPRQCAPCNVNEECDPGDGSFNGECVTRDVMGFREQVCLQICDDMMNPCPAGLDCSAGHCQPFIGASCTTWRQAVSRAACISDVDCNIANSMGSGAFFTETCEGEMAAPIPDAGMDPEAGVPDAGNPTPGTCVQPCSDSSECFDAAGGQMCLDTGSGLTFCIVPPPPPP